MLIFPSNKDLVDFQQQQKQCPADMVYKQDDEVIHLKYLCLSELSVKLNLIELQVFRLVIERDCLANYF